MVTKSISLGEHYYDISPEISSQTAVYPGDVKFKRSIHFDQRNGDPLLLSSIESTVHVGAHTDAPNHYHPDGTGIENRDINYYLGGCQVISVKIPPGKRIELKDISKISITEMRVLFKTESFSNPNQWNADFNSLSPELVNSLSKLGVVLIGIDTPSIDPADSKELEAHQAIFKNNMAILEGITLTSVPDGPYNLIALPLKIKGCDASPVRAVLVKKGVLF
ncbi:MAG: cyclase family protein [Bdellovibrionota bacterium]